jgi:hypothetical protein
MDNDSAIKKRFVQLYRKIRLNIDYCGMNFVAEQKGNELIADCLSKSSPFMVGRFGAVEMRCVSKWIQGEFCSEAEKGQALYAAGIFPNDNQTIEKFCEIYTEAMKQCDLLGVWEVAGEKRAIKEFCNNPVLMPSRAIEPYYYDRPWSAALEHKKVLIVHPFVESIEAQIGCREKIWPNKKVLPQFASVDFVRAIQSNAGGKTEFKNWIEALEFMKHRIAEKEFDVAIIGAGAYGFPLAAYVKSLGKQAIQMSGATQILFGIRGKRWDEHPLISKFYNDSWVRPLKSETPPEIKKVEGGSYW